ncbi:MAG: HDOD domain-containing protein [Desulfovibrionaceae bacterium]
MSQEAGQQFLAELPDIRHDLPYSPELLQKLFMQTRDDSYASLEAIAGTISSDQGLTAKVLSLANSAFYGLQAQVSSVTRAIAVLGLREIRNIVLSLGVSHLTRLYPPADSFDLEIYWRHQMVVALSAKTLTRKSNGASPDTMFAAGLLHDLGKLIIAMHRPKDWEAIHQLTQERDIPYLEAEEMHWGLDHAIVGALVMRSWDLPADLSEAVNWHHSPELAPDHKHEAELLCLADALAHRMQNPETSFMDVWMELSEKKDIDRDDVLEEMERDLDMDSVDRFVQALV